MKDYFKNIWRFVAQYENEEVLGIVYAESLSLAVKKVQKVYSGADSVRVRAFSMMDMTEHPDVLEV